MVFQASLFGVDLKNSNNNTQEYNVDSPPENTFQFGAPEQYANLSQQEKEDLTKKMMGLHKQAHATGKFF